MSREVRRPEDDRLIGQVIDERYRVLRRLGAGGMGAVYVAASSATPVVVVGLP